MLRAKKRTPIIFPFVVFTFGLTVESIKELGGASDFLGPLLGTIVVTHFFNLK
jgi:ABC-type branched-subunit amino acid transport system permease subunit